MAHGRDKVIRNYTHTEEHKEREKNVLEEGGLPIFTLTPEMFRERKPEEMEELRRAHERERAGRYRGVYTILGLRLVAHKDGAPELTWKAGEGVCEACASPRCRAAATTS